MRASLAQRARNARYNVRWAAHNTRIWLSTRVPITRSEILLWVGAWVVSSDPITARWASYAATAAGRFLGWAILGWVVIGVAMWSLIFRFLKGLRRHR